jgi:transcriptional regulator
MATSWIRSSVCCKGRWISRFCGPCSAAAHGHEIAKYIQRTSEELLQVEKGSLYPALHRLEAKGWIEASWELSDKGKRARYYRLTRDGRKQLSSERSKWDAFARAMGLILAANERP